MQKKNGLFRNITTQAEIIILKAYLVDWQSVLCVEGDIFGMYLFMYQNINQLIIVHRNVYGTNKHKRGGLFKKGFRLIRQRNDQES